MADAELRALEREVATTGDPAARIELARHLERLGRRDDALLALWPGRESAEVRRALAGFPAFDERSGGGLRYVDTAPLRAPPRVRWRRSIRSPDRRSAGRVLVASPLGLVCWPAPERLLCLDPEDGHVRWVRERPGLRDLRLAGEELRLAEPPEVTRLDLWTGEELGREPEVDASPEVRTPTVLAASPTHEVALRTPRNANMFELVLRRGMHGPEVVLCQGIVEKGVVAIARDVIFQSMWHLPGGWPSEEPLDPAGPVCAHASDGRLLWRLGEADGVAFAAALAPLAGRLYALTHEGTVLCLEA